MPVHIQKSFGQLVAEGAFANHVKWSKIGFTPSASTLDSDIWSYGGTQPNYLFPTSACGMELLGSASDLGTVIKGAMDDSVTSDAGGSTTTLVDANVDFTAATAVEVGDCVILDPHGASPEWGYVTTVAAHTLTCGTGFSAGGSGSLRKYAVIDQTGSTGAQAMKIEYLDGSYAQKSEIVALNGASVVPTVNLDLFRINSFRVIAAGSRNNAAGALFIRNLADTPVYSYITAGFTRARNVMYTVPAGKTLWVTQINVGYGVTGNGKVEFARIWTRANVEPATMEYTRDLFYAYSEIIATNTTVELVLLEPTRLPAKTDIKVSCLASAAGQAIATLRGYLTTP
jgi:hypothetical protein